jgi:hypothetical protein
MTPQTSTDIQSTLSEHPVFDSPSEFSSKAHIASMADFERLYEEADRDPESSGHGSRANQITQHLPFHNRYFALPANIPDEAQSCVAILIFGAGLRSLLMHATCRWI